MKLSVGIVGLPNSGKSTLFNALAQRQLAPVGKFPFTTIEPNKAVAAVPDENLGRLAKIFRSAQTTPAVIDFIDIAGLIKNAHQGEGLGNQFLGHIRDAAAILHVVRAFERDDVPHVHGKIDPKEDAEVVNRELELAKIKKPTLYIINVSEADLGNPEKLARIRRPFSLCKSLAFTSAKLEAELAELPEAERQEYLESIGIKQSALTQIVQKAYQLLNLITFYTGNPNETRASSLKHGSSAIDAAGQIHTDFAQNFIKAEVVEAEKLIKLGSWQKAKEKGQVRVEGRDYAVQNQDVILFRSN